MQTQQESSVLFNLQELMRIEQERVENEATAERALRAQALERERREAEEAARQLAQARAMEQQVLLQQQRQAQEAQALAALAEQQTLAQTRAELEASAQAERARLQRAHELSLAQIEAQSSTPWVRQALIVLTLVGALAAAGYFGVVAPLLAQSRALEAETRALAQAYAAQIDALRSRPSRTPASNEHVGEVVAMPQTESPPAARTPTIAPPKTKRPRAHVTKHTTKTTRTTDPLGDPADGDDPIFGL